jgi:hypothetical protein
MSWSQLATLMAVCPTVADVQKELVMLEAGKGRSQHLDVAPDDVQRDIQEISELNEWLILNVVNDPEAMLPTGGDATWLLRHAWNPVDGTFTFGFQGDSGHPVLEVRPGRDSDPFPLTLLACADCGRPVLGGALGTGWEHIVWPDPASE